MWDEGNKVVYGEESMLSSKQERRQLQWQVEREYELYQADKFIISRIRSQLFDSRTLKQRVQHDNDGIRYWLADVKEAKEAQTRFRAQAAAVAKTFFQPRQTPQESIASTSWKLLAPLSQDKSEQGSLGTLSIETRTYGTVASALYGKESLETRMYCTERSLTERSSIATKIYCRDSEWRQLYGVWGAGQCQQVNSIWQLV